MKTLLTMSILAVVAASAMSAQNAKPQGFTPTDPRSCERQMAIAMRNVAMGSFETLSPQRISGPKTAKSSDAAQFSGPTRQQAMDTYRNCPPPPALRGSNAAPVVPVVKNTKADSK